MSVLIDVLGAIIIGGLLLIMLITFNYQLTENAERQLYAMNMTEHMENACVQLNYVIGFAGLGIEDFKESIVSAQVDIFEFQTYWDVSIDRLGNVPRTISISLDNTVDQGTGKAIVIKQGSVPLENFGYIFWVSNLEFDYFDIDGVVTNATEKIRSVELRIEFSRPAPRLGSRDLTNRLQLKCFLMNLYLQEGVH